MVLLEYWDELCSVVTVILVGVMSPGPDWAIVIKNSLKNSRRAGMWAALGIAMGVIVHISYCILGIGMLLSQCHLLFKGVKFIGGSYLCFLGYKGLRSKSEAINLDVKEMEVQDKKNHFTAFKEGVFTNIFNPKCTLFFLSLFSLVIDPITPIYVQILYGLAAVIVTAVWFCLLALVFSHEKFYEKLFPIQHWIQRFFGMLLIFLGIYFVFIG